VKNIIKRISALLAGVMVLCSQPLEVCAEKGYTYNYDWWEDVQYSPDLYEVIGVFTASDLGITDKFSSPQGLYVCGSTVYICDTGNNRIVEMERTKFNNFSCKRIIDSFQGDVETTTFASPTDIAVSEDGYLYIADMNNGRILKLDQDLNYVMQFDKPVDSTIDPSASFLPSKISIDTAGRVYCVATNINQGLIKYENDGSFSGFVGATKVTYDWTDYLWKRLATKEQRAQLASFVPTEYSNLYMDTEGFIYACTVNVTEEDLAAGNATPIRKLNLMGDDILVRNGSFPVVGDLWWNGGTSGYDGPSLMTDITALDNDIYVGLDRVRGRMFGYNDQGNLVFVFGGNGNMDGYFRQPAAIDHMGHDLLVLDSVDCSITLFAPTEFGGLVYDAIEQFQDGKYYESGETWKQVMVQNGNYDLAYIGIGRSLLRQEKYHEAMEYFELKWDYKNYSKAFKQYRKEWVEEHIVMILLVLFLVICLPLFVGKVKKIKHEIDTADIFKV